MLGQTIAVYIRQDGADISSLPGCRVFSQDGRLRIDCAPPLHRRYTAAVPNGAMFARATDGGELAVFIAPSSDLARLITKLWEKEERRAGSGES